ncbi:MAG: lactate utilization protein, partial [Desulfofundulus sp.]
ADIERVLTIGVHGPGKVVVVFVDEGGGAGE